MIVLNRIDSRLIHGQVIEAWLPHFRIARVVVADDESADDALAKAVFRMAIPSEVDLLLNGVTQLDYAALGADSVRTLVLFRDVKSAERARQAGLPAGLLNVGNVHSTAGSTQLTPSVYLDESDTQVLRALAAGGMDVVLQAIPAERPVALPSR